MASTHGRKRLPLPDSLETDLRRLGFRRMVGLPESEPDTFRIPATPKIWVSIAPSNIPGEPYVIARWGDGDSTWMLRIHIDQLVHELEVLVARAASVNRVM